MTTSISTKASLSIFCFYNTEAESRTLVIALKSPLTRMRFVRGKFRADYLAKQTRFGNFETWKRLLDNSANPALGIALANTDGLGVPTIFNSVSESRREPSLRPALGGITGRVP